MSSRVKVGRNEACPCHSGKKYKHCCYSKGFEWVRAEDGSIGRSIPLSEDGRSAFQEARQLFRDKHGRDPGPDDRLFDHEPEHLEHQLVETMKRAGFPKRYIYAFEKTGRLVSEENKHLIPDIELQKWYDAVAEYDRLHG